MITADFTMTLPRSTNADVQVVYHVPAGSVVRNTTLDGPAIPQILDIFNTNLAYEMEHENKYELATNGVTEGTAQRGELYQASRLGERQCSAFEWTEVASDTEYDSAWESPCSSPGHCTPPRHATSRPGAPERTRLQSPTPGYDGRGKYKPANDGAVVVSESGGDAAFLKGLRVFIPGLFPRKTDQGDDFDEE
ncbi:hypothetical protein BJX61DRAFT_338765 [Aspergillus egyptiacus]|nr:hypothetical protein BJX61DRAFT_338765 [Aspergillus egyptiacus]